MKRLIFLAIAIAIGATAWYLLSRRPSPTTPKLPATENEFKQMPGGAATIDAGEYIISRAKEGSLPGWSKDDHGSLVVPNIKPPEEQTEAYPILRIIRLRKNRDTSEYYYWVTRESERAPWQLKKALRASPDGQTREEYSL